MSEFVPTNEWAIEILQQQKFPYPEYDKDIEVNMALDRGIKALKSRPQGQWIMDDLVSDNYEHCSCCGWGNDHGFRKYNFCPNCGAIMREKNYE